MVVSNLNSEIKYDEKQELNAEDENQSSAIYELRIFDKNIVIAIGQPKYTYSGQQVVYFPIYMVNGDEAVATIGVFEIEQSQTLKMFDENKNIIVSKLPPPLLFEIVTEKFVTQHGMDVNIFLKQSDRGEKTDTLIDLTKEPAQEEKDELDIAMDLPSSIKKLQQASPSLTLSHETLKHGIFTKDTSVKLLPLLEEETKENADKLKSEYKESAKGPWIQKYMKNNHYKITEVAINGDCLFDVIRIAFKQIGENTTIDILRSLVAAEVTDEIYQEKRRLFMDLLGASKEMEAEQSEIKKNLERLKRRATSAAAKREDTDEILKEVGRLKELYAKTVKRKKNHDDFREESVGHMAEIDTFEKYRAYMLTRHFWADAWVISTLERILNIKMIIFSEASFKDNAINSVLNCGETNKKLEAAGVPFSPKFYIMTTYSGDHYKLITYKDKGIFTHSEIPYYVKTLIVKKCMEKNSGIFYMIDAFKNLKSQLGLDPDLGKGADEMEDTEHVYNELYNPDVIFQFHGSAQNAPNPGQGSGEKIPMERMPEFVEILKSIPNWRRKLDDTWMDAPFVLHGKKWPSVEHYYQAGKFMKKFPTFADQFSLASESEISKDVALAKKAGSKTSSLRPKNVSIDPDFFEGFDKTVREEALVAKFEQNEDMKTILKATKDAKLMKYVPGAQAEPDIVLMKIRGKL